MIFQTNSGRFRPKWVPLLACEAPEHFRSSLPSLLAIFRRERSDDRKCVWRFAGYTFVSQVWKSVILVCKKKQNKTLSGCEIVEKTFSLCGVLISILLLTAVKKDARFYYRYVNGVQFVNRRYTKGVPFLLKMVCNKV